MRLSKDALIERWREELIELQKSQCEPKRKLTPEEISELKQQWYPHVQDFDILNLLIERHKWGFNIEWDVACYNNTRVDLRFEHPNDVDLNHELEQLHYLLQDVKVDEDVLQWCDLKEIVAFVVKYPEVKHITKAHLPLIKQLQVK